MGESLGDRVGISLIEIAVPGAGFLTISLANLVSYRLYDIKIADPHNLLIGGVGTIAYAMVDSGIRLAAGKGLTERMIEASYSLYKRLSKTIKT